MSFDRLAPHYTWMETVLAGRRLQRARVTWMEALAGCERMLVAGVGHGHFLREALRRFPRLEATAVDASEGMLARARGHLEREGLKQRPVTWVRANLPAWRPERERYNAVVTPFFLDCFASADLAEVVAALAAGGRPEAKWLVTDFAVPARGIARQRARVVHALMYAFFRRATGLGATRMTAPDEFLAAHGFRLKGRKTSEWGLLQADWWER